MTHHRLVLALLLIAAPVHAQRITLESLAIDPPLSSARIAKRLDGRGWLRTTPTQRAEDVRLVAALGNRSAQLRFLNGWIPGREYQQSHVDADRWQAREPLDRQIAAAQRYTPRFYDPPRVAGPALGTLVQLHATPHPLISANELQRRLSTVPAARKQLAILEEWHRASRQFELERGPHALAEGSAQRQVEEKAQAAFRSKVRETAHEARYATKALSRTKQVGLGAALGLGATAVTNPEALQEKGFWKSMAGSLTGGAVGSALATAARGTPLWPLALAAPVVGGILGGDLAGGRKVDWTRIGAHAVTALAAAALLPASMGILTGAAVMMGVGYATDWLHDRYSRPEPTPSTGAVALLDVKSAR